jgi:hypothetical protein
MTSHASLTTALRAHAKGLYCLEAAAELLISHRTWLHRGDFTAFITTGYQPGDTSLACISWHAAITALQDGQLPCSGSESAVLRIAASIAEGIPVDLHEALTRLDNHNADLVTRAVQHATGNSQ